MKKLIFFFIFLLVLLPVVSAEEFGYNYLEGELNVVQAINYTLVSVNDSLLWDGNAWDESRWIFTSGDTMTGDLVMSADINLDAGQRLEVDGHNLLKYDNIDHNVQIGGYAGASFTTATNNVLIGDGPGNSLTSGGSNVFLGRQAGRLVTTGGGSVAMGNYALSNNNPTGAFALGQESLRYSDGYGNIAIGSYAGTTFTTGANNVMIGAYAGNNATGNLDQNIFIGAEAGRYQVSGVGNILIGYQVEAPNTAGNNQINIGNLIYGVGGKIGIGTASPNSMLHIIANIPGTVGSHAAGQLIIQNPTDSVFSNVVITGYESDGAGNPDQQLWYLGSSSVGNSDIIFLNRRNSKLHLGTNGLVRMTIDSGGSGGSVGIGTESPNAKLEVVGNVRVFKSAGNPRILVGDNATTGQWGGLDWDSTSDYLQIINSGYSGSNGVINILSSGYVGIGTTTPQNTLNVLGDFNQSNGNSTINLIYGEMWYHNHTATQLNFASDGLFYNLTFDNSLVNGFIFNDANDYLEAQIGGIYKASYMASGDGQNNHEYYTSVFINGANQDKCESHKKMVAGGDIVTMTGSCLLSLSVGDKVKLATADIGSTGTGNYYSSELNLVRVGN